MTEPVRIEGLREFRQELKRLGPELGKELRQEFKTIAELIATRTRESFRSRPGVAPKVAPSVRALAQQRGASVKIGGPAYPYAMGSEFGSIAYRQFPAWRGSGGDAGYSLYPAVRDQRERVVDEVARVITTLARRAFPD